MSNIIPFDQISRMKQELAEKTEQLSKTTAQLAQVKGVNEMLKLQVADLQDQIDGMVQQLQIIQMNLKLLAAKLPDLD